MATSQNGWPANNRSLTKVWTIPGTSRTIRLEAGDAGFILCHFAAWFDKNIEDIEAGQLDDWGYAERPIRGGTTLSNHASGTAIDLNAVKHPLAAVGTFTPAQRDRIRAKLREYGGVIRWGGDYSGRKDEMHFEINASFARTREIATRLRNYPTPNNDLLEPGDSGEDVRRLQEFLNRVYPSYSRLTVDGDYGPATQAVVMEFQRRSGLAADGIVGPATKAALGFK